MRDLMRPSSSNQCRVHNMLSRSAAASRSLPSAISIKKGDKGPSDSENTLYCSTSHRGADGSSTYPRAATESHCRGRYLGPINHSVEGTPAEVGPASQGEDHAHA